jgi:hypothetical protein
VKNPQKVKITDMRSDEKLDIPIFLENRKVPIVIKEKLNIILKLYAAISGKYLNKRRFGR